MAKIPDSLDLATVQGALPATDVVEPTDFGLGQVAGVVGQVADRRQQINRMKIDLQDKADERAARPHLEGVMNAQETAMAQEGAAYTGDEPGFATDQIAKARERVTRFDPGDSVSPGVRRHYQQLGEAYVASVGQRAIAHEAQVRAEPIAAQRQAADDVQVNGGLTSFFQSFAPKKQELLDNYDGSQPGLTTAVGQAFDASAQAAIAAAPARLQPALQVKLASMRTEEIAAAGTVEQKGADSHILVNGLHQWGAQVNTVLTNPLAYDNVTAQGLPAIEATIPAGLRRDFHTQAMAQAATARIKGLLAQDKIDQAKAELADGRYDAFLKPEVKEQLVTEAAAAGRAGAKTYGEYMAGEDVGRRAEADLYAWQTTGRGTGQVNLDEIAARLGPAAAAKYESQRQEAVRQFAATGDIRERPNADLAAMASAPPPDPSSPDYATHVSAWEAQQKAASAELKARQDSPGGWAWTAAMAKDGFAAEAAPGAANEGGALQAMWSGVLSVQGAQRATAGARYAASMLAVQQSAGISGAAMQVVPGTEASRLAGAVVNATPETRLATMQQLAGIYAALPEQVRLPDGSIAGARAMFRRQLQDAHLSPMDVSAIVDFGGDPAKLGRYVAALNDTTLKGALGTGDETKIKGLVRSDLQPYLDSVRALPGSQDLMQARIDRTALIATGLMVHQHMSAEDAAATAAGDVAGRYRYVDGWRMPEALAGEQHWNLNLRGPGMNPNGAQLAKVGAAKMLGQLTANGGANLYAPSGLPGGGADRRALYARQVMANAHWVTAPDDSGLILMVPNPDGSQATVADRWGRPVRASWTQLSSYAFEDKDPFSPPASQPTAPSGRPVPATSRQGAFEALSWAVTGQESRFRNGLVSPAGALGLMQVMPDTVRTYAPRLGLPVDLDRAKNDPAYNRRIGEAALADLVNHYGSGNGVGLALAAYNAGPGRLEGYRDQQGRYHPGWLQTIGDPRKGQISLTEFIDRLPPGFKETRDYVRAVLPHALARLEATH